MSEDKTSIIIHRLDRNEETLSRMADSMTELTQVLVRKEVSDEHIKKEVEAISVRQAADSQRIHELEKIALGEEVRNSITTFLLKAAGTVFVTFVIGGILWSASTYFLGG